jgi:transposase-like protein
MSEVALASSHSRAAVRLAWIERLDRFAAAGLSVVAFCRSEGVSPQAFYYWKRQLTPAAPAADHSPRLLPVRLRADSAPIELALPTGAVLRIPTGCDLVFLRSLVEALGDVPC